MFFGTNSTCVDSRTSINENTQGKISYLKPIWMGRKVVKIPKFFLRWLIQGRVYFRPESKTKTDLIKTRWYQEEERQTYEWTVVASKKKRPSDLNSKVATFSWIKSNRKLTSTWTHQVKTEGIDKLSLFRNCQKDLEMVARSSAG